jgi:Flp pilus assembly protein TadD
VLLMQQAEPGVAMVEFQEAVRLQPTYADAQYYIGLALKKEGKAEDAAAAFRRAQQLDPHLAPPVD